MKKRITNKALMEKGYKKIIRVGCYELQTLLKCENAVYFNCGRCGWNYDVYEIDNCAIVTGYRNLVVEKAKVKIVEEYEKKAINFLNDEKNRKLSYDDVKKALHNLILDFLKKA